MLEMSDTFFDRIELRLIATGQTEEAASKRAGRNRGYIRDLKRKMSVPNSKNIAALAVALECSSEYLLGRADKSERPRRAIIHGTTAEEMAMSNREWRLIVNYRALPAEAQDWILQQVLREGRRANIAADGTILKQLEAGCS